MVGKTDLRWIKPTTSNLRHSPGDTYQNTREKTPFKLGAPVWYRPKTLVGENQ